MPIYEYHCSKCSRDFEVIQKITAEPLKKCEECGGKLEKLVSQSSFRLMGSGWYATDYAKKPETFKDRDKGSKETKPAEDKKK